MSIYSPNAIIRDFPDNLVGIRQRTRYIPDTQVLDFELSLVDVAVLELFAFYPDSNDVFREYSRLDLDNNINSLYESMCETEPRLRRAEAVHIHIGKTSIQCEGFVFNEHGGVDFLGRMELSGYAAEDSRVAVAILLAKGDGLTLQSDSIGSFDDFTGRLKKLEEGGFLLPDVGSINWGDLRRPQPLCQFFGFMRGTPIDRYYLDRFVESIQAEVCGTTLEIGGEKANQESYGFKHATEYRVLDLPGWSDDIVGDATDPEAVADNSFDSIVIFNVLEHCEYPQVVVDNIYKWLKPGGRVFAMVPCAQRIHPTPRDYWRPMPDGLRLMFKAFQEQQVTTYGNVTTVIASFHGVAVEELTTGEMDFAHPDYPVIACIVARK